VVSTVVSTGVPGVPGALACVSIKLVLSNSFSPGTTERDFLSLNNNNLFTEVFNFSAIEKIVSLSCAI
jgi:hypothetical protein